MLLSQYSIILLFGVIHFLEYASFLTRIAGIETGSKVTSYTLQQSVFVITRFFFVAMMPLIGFIVDKKVSHVSYLMMISSSLLVATLSYVLVYILCNRIITFYIKVINNYKKNSNLIKSLIQSLYYKEKIYIFDWKEFKEYYVSSNEGRKLILTSSVVFSCYSIGVFFSFYLALIFFDYRSAIGQMSGMINAMATLLLTFYIEPKISVAIDNNDKYAKAKVISILLGRFIGVSVVSQILVFLVFLSTH